MASSHSGKFYVPVIVKQYVYFYSYKYFMFQKSPAKCNNSFFSKIVVSVHNTLI